MPSGNSATFEPRTVEIVPPSLRAETIAVARLSVVIIAVVGFYLANTAWSTDPRTARAAGLLPFQKLVAEASSPEQRMFRELQEGLLEAERLRSATGAWPSPAALADAGVPPFAPDPTDKGPAYRWVLTHRDISVNYRGVPTTAGASSWLILVQEPVPGAPPDPAAEDEEHHRLADKTMLHVSVWEHADGDRLSPALVQVPQAEGWIQLRVNAPVAGYRPPAVTTP
jgi:hypothetical protein